MAGDELITRIKDFLVEVYSKMELGGKATTAMLVPSGAPIPLNRGVQTTTAYYGTWVRRNRESIIYAYFQDGYKATWEGLPVSVPAAPFPEENIGPEALEILRLRFPDGYRPSKAGHDMWAHHAFESFAVADQETHYEVNLTVKLVDGYTRSETYDDSLVLIPSGTQFLIVSHSRKPSPSTDQ